VTQTHRKLGESSRAESLDKQALFTREKPNGEHPRVPVWRIEFSYLHTDSKRLVPPGVTDVAEGKGKRDFSGLHRCGEVRDGKGSTANAFGGKEKKGGGQRKLKNFQKKEKDKDQNNT